MDQTMNEMQSRPNGKSTVFLRRFAVLCILALLLFCSPSAVGSRPAAAYPVPEDGKVENGSYINEYFGLRYPLLPHWTEDLEGPSPSTTGYYSLSALKLEGPTAATMLIAAQDNFFAAQPAKNPLDFLTQMKQHLDSSLSVPGPPVLLQIAG